MALARMKGQGFARFRMNSVFSYQSPAKIADDLSMRVRNDLSCGTWDSGNSQQLKCHSQVWTAKGTQWEHY